MDFQIPEFLPEATILVILLVLLRGIQREFRMRWFGATLVTAGMSLLLLGTGLSIVNHLELAPPASLLADEQLRIMVEQVLGQLGGFVLVALGLLTIAPRLLHEHREHRSGPPSDREAAIYRRVHDLELAQEMLSGVLKSSMSGVMILRAIRDEARTVVDFDCRIANGAVEQLLGRTCQDLLGPGLLEKLPCLRQSDLLTDATGVLESGLPLRCERYFSQGHTGTWYQIVAIRLGDGLVINFADITDRKRTEEQLRHDAHHDALTGLPNRACFVSRLQEAIMRARRFDEYNFAVLFLDFDRFKVINDSLGHDAGDQLLIGIAERLRSNLRSLDATSRTVDGHVPARLGGDEFVVLVDGVQSVHDAVSVADRLQSELSQPYPIGDHEITTTASIGIVFTRGNYGQPEDILRDADAAMYQAKRGGRARHVVFDPSMHAEAIERLELESGLREAVEEHRLSLHYAPIARFDNDELIGVEAIVSWDHPTLGVLRSDEFMPLAQELGLDQAICEWVMHQACRDTRLPARTSGAEPLRVHVNLVGSTLLAPDLPDMVAAALRAGKMAPPSIALELTHAMAERQIAAVRPMLDRLRQSGAHIVLDAFGTGASPLECIQRVIADSIKIDRAFVDNIEHLPEQQAIVKALGVLADELDVELLVDGVRTQEQATLLARVGCHAGQGPFIGQPVDAGTVRAWLHEGTSRRVA